VVTARRLVIVSAVAYIWFGVRQNLKTILSRQNTEGEEYNVRPIDVLFERVDESTQGTRFEAYKARIFQKTGLQWKEKEADQKLSFILDD
jgi:hypothetical protein